MNKASHRDPFFRALRIYSLLAVYHSAPDSARAVDVKEENTKRKSMKIKALIAVLTLGLPAVSIMAQNAGDRPNRGEGRQRPMPAIVAALDANGDGEIDAEEIKNAVAVLKKLDKDGNGKLSREEIMGARPGPGQGPGQGRRQGQGQGRDQGPRPRRPANQ